MNEITQVCLIIILIIITSVFIQLADSIVDKNKLEIRLIELEFLKKQVE